MARQQHNEDWQGDYPQVPETHKVRTTVVVTALGLVAATGLIYSGNDLRVDRTAAQISANDYKPAEEKPEPTVPPAPTPTASLTPTPSETLDLAAQQDSCIKQLTFEQILTQMMLVPVKGDASYAARTQATFKETKRVINTYQIGGVIVTANPAEDRKHNLRQYTDTKQVYGRLMVLADASGGTASVVKDDVTNEKTFPAQEELLKQKPEQMAELAAKQYIHLAKTYGITAVTGPDVSISKLASGDPAVLANGIGSYVSAGIASGVNVAAKFDGKLPLGADDPTKNALKVYEKLKGNVPNVAFPAGTDGKQQRAVNKWLTGDLGATGLTIAGDLSGTLEPSELTAAYKEALVAGADMFAYVKGDPNKYLSDQVMEFLIAGRQLEKAGQVTREELRERLAGGLAVRGVFACDLVEKKPATDVYYTPQPRVTATATPAPTPTTPPASPKTPATPTATTPPKTTAGSTAKAVSTSVVKTTTR